MTDQSRNVRYRFRLMWAVLGFAVILFVLIGHWGYQWRTSVTDRQLRARLRQQASALSNTINAEQILNLSFNESDSKLPEFQRFNLQMTDYKKLINCHGIWTAARLDNGDMVFGPGSYSETGAKISPLGAVNENTPQALADIFRHGQTTVIGPYTEEHGTFVSAVAPVHHPRSREVLMTVGIDIEATKWQKALSRAGQQAVLAVFGLCVVVLGGIVALYVRQRLNREWRKRMRHTETIAIAIFGVLVTFLAAWLFHDTENRFREKSFRQLAQTHFLIVQEAIDDLRNHRLESLSRFYGSSEFVNREEFRNFTSPMVRRPDIHAIAWVIKVPSGQLTILSDYMSDREVHPFYIWEKDGNGERKQAAGRQIYYPVWYAEPKENGENALGFDFGSDPRRLKALNTAAATGLPTATDPVRLISIGREEYGLLVVQPVVLKGSDMPEPLRGGFILAALRPDLFLKAALALETFEKSPSILRLHQHYPDTGFQPIATSGNPDKDSRKNFLPSSGQNLLNKGESGALCGLFPIFAFGKTYALEVRPTPSFIVAHPARAAWIALLTGGLFTILATLLTLLITRRRIDLENQVQARTAELLASRETIAKNERFLNSILESVQDGISVLGTDLTIIHANQVMHRWYPFDKTLIGHKCYHMYHNRDKPCDPCPSLRCMESGLMERDIVAGRPGSAVEWLELYSYPIKEPDTGEVTGVVEFVRDITEQRKLQAQLFRSQKMESVGRLAGGIAHDFNNMLSVISGYSELLAEKLPAGHPGRQDVKEIAQAADRSALLVRQLLAFARKQTIAPVTVDLNTSVSNMLKILERMLGKNISLSWAPGKNLWHIKMDPSQVDQILANLVVNSRDAISGTGQVTIETANVSFDETCHKNHPDFAPGEYVMLAVSDNGRGMDQTVMEQLFEPFFTTKPQGRGTGLGLSTVYGIVRQNKGFINVYSEPAKGSTFKVYLPRHIPADHPESKPAGTR